MDITGKLWGMCHTLRHDGIDYGDYIEQLTYLLFLKMADEKGVSVDDKYNWQSLINLSGTDLLDHYTGVLQNLRKAKGILGEIFVQAVPRFNNPVNIKKVLNLIDEIDWTSLDVDVKGEAFEGLLEKAASEGKKGAGQYFTPRPLIRTIVNVMQPDPLVTKDFKICDPACGTSGFLMVAYEWLVDKYQAGFDKRDTERIRKQTFYGQELVPRPRRLALMNMFLHGIEPKIKLGDSIYDPFDGEQYDCILTNPPFGTKGANQTPGRDDFTVQTSNKQLNFIQHVVTILKPGGRAAMVLPDNVLFADQAGDVIKNLMEDCNLHTLIRLPNGTFTPYSQGVKANVLFFQKGMPTEEVWIYDNRTNIPGVTKKERPLTEEMFADFITSYGNDPDGRTKRTDTGEEGRFRVFDKKEIAARNYNLDLTWLRDDSLGNDEELPEPELIAAEAITELNACIDDLQEILDLLENGNE